MEEYHIAEKKRDEEDAKKNKKNNERKLVTLTREYAS
jgi:hypothetical protein